MNKTGKRAAAVAGLGTSVDIDALCEGLPEFTKAKPLAERIGVTQRHVEHMCAKGEIPSIRIGRSLRIPTRQAFEAMALAGRRFDNGEATDND